MRIVLAAVLGVVFIFTTAVHSGSQNSPPDSANKSSIFGFRSAVEEGKVESRFLAVPDPKLAEEHLRILTQAPHIAGSAEDKATADYVAKKFREAGLDTEIVEYKVWMNYPKEISVDVTAPANVHMHGPARERVDGDPFQDDPRVVMPFNGMSPSGDAEAEIVYANYGTAADFKKLDEMKIDVRGKIVLARYGENFRGVKAFIAQQHGAAGLIIYSDPADDGWQRGDKYPQGPWHPDTGVQRGSVGYMFEFPGDPTTPGIASTPDLPDSKRTSPSESAQMPKIPVTPISYADAWPILAHLGGPDTPREWQGALPFTYHTGPGPVKVKMHLKQDYQFRTIWDVIGRVAGSGDPDSWVIAGNHRDAWVYGAVDPNSGTAAMLEAVHGIGELLKSGWKPKRTIVFGSWDAEEEGLIGSTEWGEQHEGDLGKAVAYFNVDVAVSGQKFGASGVPSLKQFLRDVSKDVPSPAGGTVYDAWRSTRMKPVPALIFLQRPAKRMFRLATWAADLIMRCFYSIWACPPPISVPVARMAFTIRYLTILRGSRNSAILISSTSKRWREFSGCWPSAWPTPMFCPTIMNSMGEKSPPTWMPPRKRRTLNLAARRRIFRLRSMRRNDSKKPAQEF
jgi:N-acetylated-alpha-linked acidic dipeptidase